MRFVAFVSGEDVRLGAEELKQLTGAKKYSVSGQIVELEGEAFDYSRLAFTKKIYELLFTTTEKNLEVDAKKFDWDEHCKGSFRVDCRGLKFDLDYLGSLVWRQLKNPKVDLKHAKTRIEFLGFKKKILVCRLLFENDEKFSERRPHLRPGFHPSSLQPKLARALINLAKVPEGGTVADPFCGTGGIILEAGLLGYRIVGSDISEEQVDFCRMNLEHFKIKKYECFVADATKVKIDADAVVTDPPYGRCASLCNSDREKLYSGFLDNAYKNLRKGSRVVIMFPNKVRVKSRFKVIAEVDHYMHHSLTRHIMVFEKS